MKKPIRKYWITKCILDCIIINIIAISSASSIQPLKLTLDQSLPLCNNYEALISEHENVPSYKTSDEFNDDVINDIPTDNDTCITYNTDNFDDDTKVIDNNVTNIVNNVESDSEAFNEIGNINGKDITRGNNLTTIYLAGYDDEIFQLKRDIEERGVGTELLICFYLCKDLHYNDLGCVYTDIKKLQEVSWKYTHFFCVDNQYLKPTWCLDDVYATYNFPKRKESTDDKNTVNNIKYTVDGMNKKENVKPMKSNVNYFKNTLDHSKYHPKVHPKENYLQDDVNIDEINQKFKERHLTRKHLNTRYVNPNYCYKQDYYLNTEEIGNPLTKEQKQTNISTPTTVKHTVCYNDIKADIDDANDLNYTIIHSKPNTILNINNDDNEDNNLDNFRQTDTTVVEDSIPSIPETINDTSKEANVIQYGNYLSLPNTIGTDANESNNADCELYNIHFNVSDNKSIDENLTSFIGCEADIIRPPSLEVIVEDNPFYHRCLPDVDTEQAKLDKTPLTAVYNNNQPLPLYNDNLKNSYVASNLNEAKNIFGQPKYSLIKSPQKPSDTIKPQAKLWKEINSTKLPNEKYLNKILDTNVYHQNKQRNKLSTNLPEMHSSINKQSNPNVPWRINPSGSCVIPYEYPVSYTRNSISLAQLPKTPSKCNQRTEDSLRSIIKEKIPLENGLDVKQTHYIEKPSPELLQKYEKNVPNYQDSYLKDSSHKNIDVTNEKNPLENSLGVNQNYYTQKPSPKLLKKHENRLPNYQNSDLKDSSHKNVDVLNEKIPLENSLGVNQNYYKQKSSPKLLQKYENRLPNYQNSDLKDDSHKNVDIMTSARKNPIAVDPLYPATDKSIKEQSYNDINLYGHNISSKPQDAQRYVNNVFSKAHNTHMNDPIKCDNSYLTIQPNSNIVNKTLQNFRKKIDDTKDIDSANLHNFPKVPLVTSTHSKFKPKDIIHPYSFDYGQDAPYVLKTKQNLGKITDVYSTSLCPYKYFPTQSTFCEPQKQYLNTLQPRKIDPILYATSKKVNFLSEMSYDLPLAYESTNKISPYLLNPVTSVTSLLNIKSSQKTSIIYPKQNDSVLSQYVSPVILYLPKYLPIASYTKSLYNYMDVYILYLKYKNLFTNSLLPKSLEDKMYPYYFIEPITRYTNNFKNSQTAPINNKTGLVAAISSLPSPFATDFSPNVIPAPTLPNEDYNTEVFTFPTAPLPATNTELGKNVLSISVTLRPILSPLYQTMPIPTTIQSLPNLLNKDQRQKAYPLRSSHPQTLSNEGISSNRLPDLISFSPATPYTDLSSIPVSSLPMSLKKELGTNSFSIPVSPLPISSWPVSLPPNQGQRLIPEPIKSSPILPKSNLSSPDSPTTYSKLPASSNNDLTSPLPSPHLPTSTLQPRTKTFPTTTHFLPILVKPDNHIKKFPSATTSLPITPKKDFILNRFPAPVLLFPFSSNTASNSKGSVIPMSPLPITINKEDDFTAPFSSLPISSALERKPETTCPTYIKPKPLYKSLPISSNIESFNDISPSNSTCPISTILDRKPKIQVPIPSLPVTSNLGLYFKNLRTPKPSLAISSPLETKSKTLASPTLPLPSSNIVPTENHPNHQTPFSFLPFPSAPEIRTKKIHPSIPSLPISSPATAVKPTYCPGHIQSLPISTNTDPSLKILTPPIYSVPTTPNIDLNSKRVPLPVSYFPVSSNKDISLKGFSPTDPGRCYPLTPISESKPKVCPKPIQSFPTASDLYFIPKNIPSSISSPSELNPKPYQYLPFSSNINRCFNVLPNPFRIVPISPIREVAPKNISSISPSPNIGRPSYFVTSFSYTHIPSNSEVATTSCPNPVKYLTPTTGLQSNITPCIPSLPTSTYTKPGQNSFSSPCISTPSTSGLNPKPRPRVNYWPISSNLDVKPKSYTPSLPKVPVTSNINLNSNCFSPAVSYLPNSLNKCPNLKKFAPTTSSWISPSNSDVKSKEFPTPNQSVPLLPNYISSTGVSTCISPLPPSFPLQIKPIIYPAPTESTISANTDSPSPVTPWPKYSSPDLYLSVPKKSDICSKQPFIESNVRFNPKLIERNRNHKNQPILSEIRDLRYPQQNLQPIPSSNTTPKSRVIFTNPNTNPSTSRNPFHQRPLISNIFPCKALNNVKPSLKSADTILYRPAPYSLISHPQSENTTNSNTYQKPEQNHANFELMTKPQVTVSTNTVPYSYSPNSLQSHPCKTSPKSTVTEPQTKLSNYSFLPFESNQGPEIMPLINTARPYLHNHSPSSTLHYKGKSTPESGSNVLHEMKLKPIPLPDSSNLRNPYLYPIFKPTKTPSILIPSETEENESNITCNLQNEIQEYLVPNLANISEYPYYTNKPILAPNFKPICSKFKLPSSSQTLITKPSDYKEKLIKVSPYNSKVPIQPSNEVLISYLPLPCRKTPINYDTKKSGSIQYPQYIPKELYNPIQRTLHRITDGEVPKSNNEIYDITAAKLTPQYDLNNKLYNKDNINKGIVIPTRRLAIARYELNNLIKINIKTSNPDIELKTWTSRLKLLKPKIVFDEVELTTFNFIPIVNNIGNYTPEMILDTVRKYVERHYGKPIVLKGTPSFYKLYTFIDNLTTNSGNIVYLIWPTVCKCNENS